MRSQSMNLSSQTIGGHILKIANELAKPVLGSRSRASGHEPPGQSPISAKLFRRHAIAKVPAQAQNWRDSNRDIGLQSLSSHSDEASIFIWGGRVA